MIKNLISCYIIVKTTNSPVTYVCSIGKYMYNLVVLKE